MARPDNPLAAICRWRRVAAKLERLQDPELQEFAADMRIYEEDAPSGRTLDQVFGVTQHGGVGSWWAQEAREQRNAAICELWNEHLPNCDVRVAATEILKLAQHRIRSRGAPRNKVEHLIDRALCSGEKFPKFQQLRSILLTSKSA